MGLQNIFSSFFSRLLLLLSFFWQVHCLPLPIRSIDSIVSIDPSHDAWADTLSGVGPLILLIGERATKQLLRNVRGTADAFSLAAAPLGLLSVVTSLIRCCGIQRLRAFIGYELEARAVAGIEMTRVNCGGVHAEIVDGYVVRSAAANPASQATAVSLLQGSLEEVGEEALLQVQMCNKFEQKSRSHGIPDSSAAAHWVLHILSTEKEDYYSVVNTLIRAISPVRNFSPFSDDTIHRFCESLFTIDGDKDRSVGEKRLSLEELMKSDTADQDSLVQKELDEEADMQDLPEDMNDTSSKNKTSRAKQGGRVIVKELNSGAGNHSEGVIVAAMALNASNGDEKSHTDAQLASTRLSFTCILDAVSEFTTTTPVPKILAFLLGLTSLLAIFAVYITALWQNQWEVSVAFILVVIGYTGIVLSVMVAALIIHSSCVCIKLESRSHTNPKIWTDGLVVCVKNTDSMDTTGSRFMSSDSGAQHAEVVWMKDLTGKRTLSATLTAMALVLFFICHYLGLRSSKWWVSVGELLVCILAAMARTATRGPQRKFSVVEGIKIDKRCTSTGIISVQKSRTIDKSQRDPRNFDARAYSMVSLGNAAVNGESIAWYAAKLFMDNDKLADEVISLTGMRVKIRQDEPDKAFVLISYTGGLLIQEGLAYPNARLCLAFRSSIIDLAQPTALLARSIMRQAEWSINYPEFGEGEGLDLGKVYIFSINSVMDWWTLSEDRNDLGDLARNLQWGFVLINTAFFIALMRSEHFTRVQSRVEKVHAGSSGSNKEVAENFVQYLHERRTRSGKSLIPV